MNNLDAGRNTQDVVVPKHRLSWLRIDRWNNCSDLYKKFNVNVYGAAVEEDEARQSREIRLAWFVAAKKV